MAQTASVALCRDRMKGAGMRFVLSASSVGMSYEHCFVYSDPIEVSARMVVRCSAQSRGTMKANVSMFVLSASSVRMLYELCFVCRVTMKVTQRMSCAATNLWIS